MVIIARRCIVSGHVQGVAYRAWTCQKAQEAGIRGWVRNLADGTVECLIQGDTDQVARMISWLREGSEPSKVTGIQCYDEEPADLDGFRVTR